jgi:outer membrane immunogenic protein
MKVKEIALVGAMIALSALPAKAETKWTGFYVGAHGGLDMTATDLGVTNIPTFLGPMGAGIDGLSSSGTAIGLNGGFDYQIPGTKVIVGIGGDYTWSNTEFNVTFGSATPLTAGLDESWAVYGRVGIDAGRVMPYVLAGYSEADVSASWMDGGTMEHGSDKMKGWLVGGGFEMMLGAGFVLGAEYRYTMFDGVSYRLDDGPPPSNLKLDTDRHEVRAKLSYKFGGLF